MQVLPIRLDDLIHEKTVESLRIEFKETWSDPICDATIRTICAFANDLLNLNGGYIILGIEEQNGSPVLPPSGLEAQNLDEIQRRIRGQCNRIKPEYHPILSPEVFQGKQILVVWVPGGDNRPYQAPDSCRGGDYHYYIRQGAESIIAKDELLHQLLEQSAKIPFDDRRYTDSSTTVDELSSSLVRKFLLDIKSDMLASNPKISDQDIYHNLRLSTKINSHEVPRNVSLLFFTNEPDKYFPGAHIEVVQFGDDAGGNLIEEKDFRGPLHEQIRQTLDYLNNFSSTMVRKIPGRAVASRTVAFPYEAMEEAIVNAAYHRSYEGVYEPTKIYFYPDRMEITSYPGPVPGINKEHLLPGARIPQVPSRNRRIGEFLKDLGLAEGRHTGIPKIMRTMSENGSPSPIFDFDDSRTYFTVILPAHPQYIVIHALRESALQWTIGDKTRAIQILEEALRRVPDSGELIAQIIEYEILRDNFSAAEKLYRMIKNKITLTERHLPFIRMAKAYLDRGEEKQAEQILLNVSLPDKLDDLIELAILYKRSEDYQKAHEIFSKHYEHFKNDPKALQEYAQTKLRLAASLSRRSRAQQDKQRARSLQRKFNEEALELLHRAIQLSDDDVRNAWCWLDIAKTKCYLHAPESEISEAYEKAVELLPHEQRFRQWYNVYINNKNCR